MVYDTQLLHQDRAAASHRATIDSNYLRLHIHRARAALANKVQPSYIYVHSARRTYIYTHRHARTRTLFAIARSLSAATVIEY